MISRIPVFLTFFAWSLSPLAAEEAAVLTPAEDAGKAAQKANAPWDSAERQAALRVQLFLDKQGFGPGKIDGRWGGFSKKAAERWNVAENVIKIPILDSDQFDVAKVSVLQHSEDLITTYQINAADQALLGTIPKEPEEMAKLKQMNYTSLIELVAEKFHADQDFLREINGLAPGSDFKSGEKIKVPNVSVPFEISEPIERSKEKKGAKVPAEDKDKIVPDMELTVLREQQVVEVREAGKLIRSFPISPGANDNESPAGDWKVSVISWMPEFRWDKSMLEDGKRSNDAHLLPPGPNNPVGVVWIGLSADGIGLHGTASPDEIGRNRSHGCIRLSNWDALNLGKTVSVGTRVVVK